MFTATPFLNIAMAVVITGAAQPILTANEERPPRLEIHDFVNDEKQFSLYVQALRNYPH
jgi:hypothetical protein